MAKAKEKDDATFEQDLESLEGIVAALEEGGLSLDAALKQFESGIHLARRCEKALAGAEKKIEILMKNADGALEPEPFDENDPPEPPKAAPVKAAPAKAEVTTPAPSKPAAPSKPGTPSKPAAPSDFDDREPEPEPDDEDLLF